MSKILSICVPSYNMEQYLERCVDSMLVDEVLDKLEIIIVNDGSKDGSLAIANGYKNRYPDSIVVIDKPNGHYGSCVNASLKVATGKYFRIVDADDWVDSDALVEFVNTLEKIDVDCVFTKYTINNLSDNTIEEKQIDDCIFDQVLDLNKLNYPTRNLNMHSLTYRLELLKGINYVQTEGICYTDTEYVFYPLIAARTIYFMNLSLYQYLVGRDDQSVSIASYKKNLTHVLLLSEKFVASEEAVLKANPNADPIRNAYLRLFGSYLCEIYLLHHPYNKELDYRIRSVITAIKSIAPQAYNEIEKLNVHKFPYVKLWIEAKPIADVCLPLIRYIIKKTGID